MRSTDVPEASRVHSEIATAYFHDAFEIPLQSSDKTALELYLGAVACTPRWINFLMTVRNRVVAFFGLKDLGQLSDVEERKDAFVVPVHKIIVPSMLARIADVSTKA